jgi:hypothetical protein
VDDGEGPTESSCVDTWYAQSFLLVVMRGKSTRSEEHRKHLNLGGADFEGWEDWRWVTASG